MLQRLCEGVLYISWFQAYVANEGGKDFPLIKTCKSWDYILEIHPMAYLTSAFIVFLYCICFSSHFTVNDTLRL